MQCVIWDNMSKNNYASVHSSFWTGETGKIIRQYGPECQVLALYLMSNRHRNALGLYYIPKVLISHETGISFEGTSKGLRSLFEGGFSVFDGHSEVVWVYEMARYQLGDSLSPKDNRVKWINTKFHDIPNNPFLREFLKKYGASYHIKNCRKDKPLGSPFEVPSKPDTDTVTDSVYSLVETY